MRKLISLLLATLATTTACDGGGGSLGGGSVVTPTPTPGVTPTPTPGPTPTPAPGSTEPANGAEFYSSIATLYSVQPDLSTCRAGTLKPEVGQRVLTVLNNIRAFHRLPPVTYASADEANVMQSALMQAANGSLSHTPPSSWACFTAGGSTASAQSNLYLGMGNGLNYTRNDDLVVGWLTDIDNVVIDSVGHRRWLLYPFLSTVAYGRVAGRYQLSNKSDGAAIKVINTTQATPATLPDIVAYPYEDYPARYFANGALFSFGVIANKSSNFGSPNGTVNYASATIEVRERGGGTLAVSRKAFDNDGYGLPNNLQWAVAGLKANTYYDVTIDRVNVGGANRTYTYFFRIVP